MNLNARITLAIKNFFRKYGRFLLIAFIIWLVIFMINQYLKNRPKQEQALINTYEPDSPVIDDGGNVPKSYVEPIKNIVDTYFNYCNKKNYEQAYNLLTDECKEYLYGNDISIFEEYVNNTFTKNKIYNLQNYSNVSGIYIYDLIILDDIESTGTTEGYEPYREKIALHKEGNTFKISNQGYIEKKDYNINVEDENIKVNIKSKDMSYKKEGYNVTITNKTDKFIIISDNTIREEITLNLGDQKRKATNFAGGALILNPGETSDEVLIFDKFYDDEKDPTQISFENVRILEEYSESIESTVEAAERMYSFNISLKTK